MPHATYMNAKSYGGETPGREVYEYALESMLNRDYNPVSYTHLDVYKRQARK